MTMTKTLKLKSFILNLNVNDNDDANDYLTEHKDTKALSFCFL